MYNKLLMVGNLTRDIELRYLQNGTAVANTAIATTRKFTSNGEKKEEVCFIDVTMFGKVAEIANQYTRKGSKVLLDGRVKFEQWTDNNGQKRSKHVFNVETLQMLDSKSDNQQSPQPNANQGYQANQNYQPEPQQNSYQRPPDEAQNRGINAPVHHEQYNPNQQDKYPPRR